MEELNSGPPKTNPSSGREEDLNPGPPDCKSNALTTRPRCLLTSLVKDRKMCEDAEKLNKCYDLRSKSIKCNAKIIQNYASMVEDVAHSVVQLVQTHMKSLQ